MNNKFYTSLLIGLIALVPIVLINCAENLITQPDNKYHGDNQVMFKTLTSTVDSRVDVNAPPNEASIEIQLVSPEGLLSEDVKIEIAIEDSSTAVENVDYKITTTFPFTIKSGNAYEFLDVEVMAEGLSQGENRILYLTLDKASVGSSSVIIAENYKTYTLIIRGQN